MLLVVLEVFTGMLYTIRRNTASTHSMSFAVHGTPTLSEYRTPQYCQHWQHQKKVSNTIHTNILYHAAASCTDTPTYSSINSSIWSTAVVLLPCIKVEEFKRQIVA